MTILRYYWYVSNVSTFSHAFPLVLDSNLHDLSETNPRLMLFSAELPWCCFCAAIEVLGRSSRNGRKFARNFYIIYKNFWSQDLPGRGPWMGTTHQGAPPLLARPGGLSPPGGPADPKTDAIKSYFSRKNQGERIIASTRRSRRHLLFFIGRPDLESVWGSGEGDLRSSSSPTLIHR
mgnify:CR=1 FL=1